MNNDQEAKNYGERGSSPSQALVDRAENFLAKRNLSEYQRARLDALIKKQYGSLENLVASVVKDFSTEEIFASLASTLPAPMSNREYYQAKANIGSLFTPQQWQESCALATDTSGFLVSLKNNSSLKDFLRKIVSSAEVYTAEGQSSIDPQTFKEDKNRWSAAAFAFPRIEKLQFSSRSAEKPASGEPEVENRRCFVVETINSHQPMIDEFEKAALERELIVSDQDACSYLTSSIFLNRELLKVFILSIVAEKMRQNLSRLFGRLLNLLRDQEKQEKEQGEEIKEIIWAILMKDLERHDCLNITSHDKQTDSLKTFSCCLSYGSLNIVAMEEGGESKIYRNCSFSTFFSIIDFWSLTDLFFPNSPWPLSLQVLGEDLEKIESLTEVFAYLRNLQVFDHDYYIDYLEQEFYQFPNF